MRPFQDVSNFQGWMEFWSPSGELVRAEYREELVLPEEHKMSLTEFGNELMKTKHTAGPWTIDYETVRSVGLEKVSRPICKLVYENGNQVDWPVMTTLTDDDREAMANAYLISAAPELLEACKAMIAYGGKYAMQDYGYPVHKKMLAAVAKAEGEEER